MTFIPVPNAGLLTAQFQDQDGVIAVNRHYMQISAAPDSAELGDVASAYLDWFVEQFAVGMENNWSLTGLSVRDMNVEDGFEFIQSSILPVNGTVGSGRLPNQVSATVTWITGIVGRSFRGRTYVVGLPGSSVATGQKRLTDVAQSDFQDRFNGLLTVLGEAAHPLVVVSLESGLVPREAGVSTLVASARMNFPLATQRRRLR